MLVISLAQIRASTSSCNNLTIGQRELVNAVDIPAVRGVHKTRATLEWPGDTGRLTSGRIYNTGYLSFKLGFWTSRNEALVYPPQPLKRFAVYSQYCYQFGN